MALLFSSKVIPRFPCSIALVMHLLDPDLQVQDVLLRQDAGKLQGDLVDDGKKGRVGARA